METPSINEPRRMRIMEVTYRGIRYWVARSRLHSDWWTFYSSHKGSWYHGHFQSTDPELVWAAFLKWLPFQVGPAQ